MSILSFFEIGFWVVRFIVTVLKRRWRPSGESQNEDGNINVEGGENLFQRRRRIEGDNDSGRNAVAIRDDEPQAAVTNDVDICTINSHSSAVIPERTENNPEISSVSDWRYNNIKYDRSLIYFHLL